MLKLEKAFNGKTYNEIETAVLESTVPNFGGAYIFFQFILDK